MKNTTTSSFIRMFKPQFAPLVASGQKLQTVRPTPKRRPAPGDEISLRAWTDKPYRSKQRILGTGTIQQVSDIEIYGDSIHITGRRLSTEEREAFAIADGFPSFHELAKWFRHTHDLPFHGIIIRWTLNPTQP
jgi:hypothetical protein